MPSLSPEDRGWKVSNLLSDRLDTAGDVETALSNGLGFVVKEIGHTGGVILNSGSLRAAASSIDHGRMFG